MAQRADGVGGGGSRAAGGGGDGPAPRYAHGDAARSIRTLHVTATATPDWVALATETTLAGLETAAASLLETETFTTTATYDVLGRPVTQTTHDESLSVRPQAGPISSLLGDH